MRLLNPKKLVAGTALAAAVTTLAISINSFNSSSYALEQTRSGVSRQPLANMPAGAEERVVSADTSFGFKAFSDISSQHQNQSGTGSDNLVFSPYSLDQALAMVCIGANGETKAQLQATLGGCDSNDWLGGRNAVDLQLRQPQTNRELNLANGVFAQKGSQFHQSYLDTLKQHFGANVYVVDYAHDNVGALKSVNGFVNTNTEGMIPTLFDRLDTDTRLVLVNAAVFNGVWETPFDPKDTRKVQFTMLDGSTEAVDMMHVADGTFDYTTGNDYQAVRLAYKGGTTMTVIVPQTGQFNAVRDELSSDLLSKVRSGSQRSSLALGLPRFSIDSDIPANDMLMRLGIRDAFDDTKANFSAMSDEGLVVSEVEQKATIHVDEAGTKASAATGIALEPTSVQMPPQNVLEINRPFFYTIEDNQTHSILFMGQVTKP